jgi:kynurenine 3-monooxygenase
MSAPRNGSVAIVGAGPTGALLSILLRRRGFDVTLYDARPDPRHSAGDSGRSINLALADRGITALERVGLYAEVRRGMVPMQGRLLHDRAGGTLFQAYGQRPQEVIHSISRHHLGSALLDVAVRLHGVAVRFEHRLESVDFKGGTASIRDLRAGTLATLPMRPLLACDGAGSALRRELTQAGLIESAELPLDHGYKELSIPAGAGAAPVLLQNALHIWPRGGYMMIALPNLDGSFTATLFLPNRGTTSFESLEAGPDVGIEEFLGGNFPDVVAAMPDRVAEFRRHPTGLLGTVHAAPWHHAAAAGHHAAAATLVGDAAHAIVPFHGQGMNCCLEDCLEFDAALERSTRASGPDWAACFEDFYARRKPNTDAIAAMALDNYLEMRARVTDPKFLLQRSLALELERRFPRRFVPRYSMVMFHHEIPYRVAAERGAVQERLLRELTHGVDALGAVDFVRAGREIEQHLPPLQDTRGGADTRSSVMKE